MNTYRFHGDLPLLEEKRKILKARDINLISSAVEMVEIAKAQAEQSYREIQEERSRQQEAGFRQGQDDSRREAIVHHWKLVIDTVTYLESVQVEIAQAIIQGVRTLIETAPPAERALQLAAAAVERLRQQAWIVLCLHSEDIDSVNRFLENWKMRLPPTMRVETRASEDVNRGDCVLESPIGRVDASLETQLHVIESQMQRML